MQKINNTEIIELYGKKFNSIYDGNNLFKRSNDHKLNSNQQLKMQKILEEDCKLIENAKEYPIITNQTYRVIYLLNRFAIVSNNWTSFRIQIVVDPSCSDFIREVKVLTLTGNFSITDFVISRNDFCESFDFVENLPHYPSFKITVNVDPLTFSNILELHTMGHDSWFENVDSTRRTTYEICYENSEIISKSMIFGFLG